MHTLSVDCGRDALLRHTTIFTNIQQSFLLKTSILSLYTALYPGSSGVERCATWRDLCAVGVEHLDGERPVGIARLKAVAGVVVQQHVRVGVVYGVAEVRRVACALVLVQLQQLLQSPKQATHVSR